MACYQYRPKRIIAGCLEERADLYKHIRWWQTGENLLTTNTNRGLRSWLQQKKRTKKLEAAVRQWNTVTNSPVQFAFIQSRYPRSLTWTQWLGIYYNWFAFIRFYLRFIIDHACNNDAELLQHQNLNCLGRANKVCHPWGPSAHAYPLRHLHSNDDDFRCQYIFHALYST